MTQEPGFRISGKFFPIPTRFRLTDPVLVEKVCGVRFSEFAARLAEAEDTGEFNDPSLIAGLVAVAMWQARPDMSRDKIEVIVSKVDLDAIEMVGMEPDLLPAEEEDAGPPAVTDTGSTGSANGSSQPPDQSGLVTIPPFSGDPA